MVDRSSKEVEQKRNFVQKSLFLQSVVDILRKKTGDINSSDGLELLIYLPIDLETEEIEAHISFDSAAKGINPNNFLKKVQNKEQIDPEYVLLFDRILQTFNVQNKELFIAMIEDTLDKDLDERIPGSEIALYDKRFAQGSIENEKKFRMLIDAYIRLTEDGNIKKVPWEEIVSFYNKQIDINYVSPTLLRLMLPYLDAQVIERITTKRDRLYKDVNDLPLAKEDKEELKKYGFSGFVPVVRGELVVKQQSEERARFVYDIKQKKVLDIAIF